MLTLYGSKGSGSAAVECALAHCGLHYRIVQAATWEPDSALGELRRVNPLGQIPALVLEDGTVLTESAAILAHLGLAHAGNGLLPEAGSARALALRGLVYIAANCYVPIGIIDYPERWTTETGADALEAVRQGARRQLHRAWDIFGDTFPATPFLGGREPGALDYLAAVVSKWAGARAHLAQARPRLAEALRAIDAHPRVAAVFARHWDA